MRINQSFESKRIARLIFDDGKTADTGQATTFANFGGFYNFTKNFSLLFTVGHSIAGERHLIGYLGLYWTW